MREFFSPDKVKEPRNVKEKALSVTELTRLVKKNLESAFGNVRVWGEVSNLRRPQSGHAYFSLKDENAQIAVVMFRNALSRVKFELKDGLEIFVYGKLTVYEARGNYQIIALSIEPKGAGALELAFRQLVEKLEKEGLFDESRKKELPPYPQRIAIVTSPTGAAVRDMLKVIFTRFPRVRLTIYPVRVQGEGAAEEIAGAIRDLNSIGGFDVMIVGRGGGSLEDLWAFNEEVLARAIFQSAIPIVSAVGHEIDITISDLVADRRALTPTNAGEIVVPRLDLILERLASIRESLGHCIARSLEQTRARLLVAGRILKMRHPVSVLNEMEMRLDDVIGRIFSSVKNYRDVFEERLGGLAARLEALSPLKVLARGFSVTLKLPERKIVKSVKEVARGARLQTLLSDGNITSITEETGEKE